MAGTHEHHQHVTPTTTTAVLEVGPMLRGSGKAVVEAALRDRPGVVSVEANPVAQTATVTYDPAQTDLRRLAQWVDDCGMHCSGRSVPEHVCHRWEEPAHGAHDHGVNGAGALLTTTRHNSEFGDGNALAVPGLEAVRSSENDNELTLNMGPQHPSTHGVFRLILQLDGFRVRAPLGVSADGLTDIFPVEFDLARRGLPIAELDLRYRDQVIARIQ